MYVVDEEHFEEVLADIAFVGEEFPEEPLGELLVFQRFPVVDVSRRELPLNDLPLVVDDQVQLEPEEPAHGALPPLENALERLVDVDSLIFTYRGCGVDDRYACTLAQGTGLEEEQKVKPHLSLTLNEAGVAYGIGEILAHVLADIAQIE